MKLTAQQEKFAQLIADGKNQSEAYRQTYDTSNYTPKSVNEAASKVMRNIKVYTRVNELKAKLEAKSIWKRKDSVQVLSEIAKEMEQPTSARVSAIKELNLMHGFNEAQKVTIDGGLDVTWKVNIVD